VDYLNSHNLLPENQSAYGANGSAETAIAKVLSDISTAIDHGDIAALALLDCSVAFDTVDHDILLHKLSESFDVGSSATLVRFVSTRKAAVRSIRRSTV
jgi:hypothetical protein